MSLGDNDEAVLYVLERFSSPTTKAPNNDEILMLLCLLEMRGDIEQVWRVTEMGEHHAQSRDTALTPHDAALLLNARSMARGIVRS